MAKINVTGNAIVLTSSIKYADIEKAKKYRPDALKLKNEDGQDVFAIDIGVIPQSNEFGIVFTGKTHDDHGFATNTVLFDTCDEGEELKNKVADFYGSTLVGLNELEKVFSERVEAIDAERKTVLSQIELA